MIMGTLLAVGYLVMFWLFGALVPEKFQSGKFPVMCITGFLLYYTLFEIVAFPMKYLCCSLKQLTVIWGCLLILLFFFVIWKRRRVLADSVRTISGSTQKNISVLILLLAAVGLAVLLGFNTNTLSTYGFFKKKEAEKTVFVILADLVLLFSYSLGGVSQYFAYRTYEGKAIIAYLYMTVIFGFCLAIYRKETSLWPWCGLFLCGTGGIAFSNSALFIVPCMIGATLFPYVLCDGILKRQWHLLKRYIIVLLPSVFWMLFSHLV